MRDYENPVHIPPLALKILTSGLIICFVIAPLVIVIKTGSNQNLFMLTAFGLAGVAFTLGGMFIQRLILWFVYTFYWYIAACGGIILFFYALAFISGVATLPPLPDSNQVSPLWNVLLAGGAFLGLIALYLVFRPTSTKQVVQVQPTTPPPAPTKQKQILNTAQQIATRKKSLGIDDDGS